MVSAPPMVHVLPLPELSAIPVAAEAGPLSPQNNLLKKGCPVALELLNKLENNAKRIPETLLLAGDDHLLAVFAGDPSLCVTAGTNCWEVVNTMMEMAFGWGLKRENTWKVQ